MAVEEGHEELLFLGVVVAQGLQARKEALQGGGAGTRGEGRVDLVEQGNQGVVFALEHRRGMARGKAVGRSDRRAFVIGTAVEEGRVHVAELLHFGNRHAGTDEVLLGLRDFMRRHGREVAHEILADAFQILAVRKTAHELFENRLAVGGIRRLRHGSRCGRGRSGCRAFGSRLVARPHHVEPGRFEGRDHLVERHVAHLAAHVERDHAAHAFQTARLRDLVEAERRHHVDDLGMRGHVFQNGLVEID